MAFPSTFLDIQNAVINKLRMDSTADLTKVKDWINQVYADACVETEVIILDSTFNLVAGTYKYDLSTLLSNAVIRIKEMYVTPVGGVQSRPLIQTDLDEILTRRQTSGGANVATGSVVFFANVGMNKLEFFPTPQSADTITIYYVALPTALSGNADVPIFPEPYATRVLEYGALAEAADFKSDPEESNYRQMFEVWKGRLRTHLTRRQGMQPGQFRIVPQGPLPPHDPSVDIREFR